MLSITRKQIEAANAKLRNGFRLDIQHYVIRQEAAVMKKIEVTRFSGSAMLDTFINHLSCFGFSLVSCDGVVAVLENEDCRKYLVSWDIAEYYSKAQIETLSRKIKEV